LNFDIHLLFELWNFKINSSCFLKRVKIFEKLNKKIFMKYSG